MKQIELIEALRSSDNLERFVRSISNEVQQYRDQLKKIGGVVDIRVSDAGKHFQVRGHEIKTLCGSFVRGGISLEELALVCDAILLDESVEFDSDIQRAVLEEMTDPEINGPFTVDRAKQILGAM